MNARIILAALALAGVAATGYWLGTRAISESAHKENSAQTERRVLYYRDPMGLPDTSPVPKKDSMGMDYMPVYEEDVSSGNQLDISVDKVQKLGVKSEAAAMRVLDKRLRVMGRIEIDERHTYTIAPKFEGWIERLHVNTTGQVVAKGQPLFEVYSPELVSAQREYALALQGVAVLQGADSEARKSMQQLADASAARLKNWDIAAGQISNDRVIFHAPVNGIVLEKMAVQGMRFMPGEALYQIADLSSVWVIADVPEQEIAAIKVGGMSQVSVEAYPGKRFDGKVDFIYPTLSSATRTVPIRIVIANPQGLLKPAMFAQVDLPAGDGSQVLTVPTSAVIDSGTRRVVLVQLGEGRFEPREVKLGNRSENHVEVLEGVAEGEQVVTSANFLIDAESNLRAVLGGFGGHAGHGDNAPAAAERKPSEDKTVGVVHQGQGTLNTINADGSVSITHGPIKTLGWPGMTMGFALANASLVKNILPGSAITFEIVEGNLGEWVIVKMQSSPQADSAHQHEGH